MKIYSTGWWKVTVAFPYMKICLNKLKILWVGRSTNTKWLVKINSSKCHKSGTQKHEFDLVQSCSS